MNTRIIELEREIISLNTKLQQIQKRSSLEDIILNGKFVTLGFYGRADGTTLTNTFDDSIILGKNILIKSVKLVPFAFVETDELYNKTTGDHFTIPAQGRLNKVVDTYSTSAKIEIRFNGKDINLFLTSNNNNPFLLDHFVDNIYYKYPNKLQDIDVRITGEVFIDFNAGSTGNPSIKMFMECYLF